MKAERVNYFLRDKSELRPWILAAGIALGLNSLGNLFSGDIYPFFAWPAARIAGFFFNSIPVMGDDGPITISLLNSSIVVTPDCDGYGFFCLLTAVFFIFFWKRHPFFVGRWTGLAILPAAYGITILLNAFRIISAYQVHLLTTNLLPESLQNFVHLGVGVVVFLTGLLGVYAILEREAWYDGTTE